MNKDDARAGLDGHTDPSAIPPIPSSMWFSKKPRNRMQMVVDMSAPGCPSFSSWQAYAYTSKSVRLSAAPQLGMPFGSKWALADEPRDPLPSPLELFRVSLRPLEQTLGTHWSSSGRMAMHKKKAAVRSQESVRTTNRYDGRSILSLMTTQTTQITTAATTHSHTLDTQDI